MQGRNVTDQFLISKIRFIKARKKSPKARRTKFHLSRSVGLKVARERTRMNMIVSQLFVPKRHDNKLYWWVADNILRSTQRERQRQ